MKWQGPFEVIDRKGDVDYEIQMSPSSTKLFHVSLLKAWNEGENATYGEEFDWDKKGWWRTKELRKHIEEGIPVSAWQTKQINQVLTDFLDQAPPPSTERNCGDRGTTDVSHGIHRRIT